MSLEGAARPSWPLKKQVIKRQTVVKGQKQAGPLGLT